jgi:hypothetical protein
LRGRASAPPLTLRNSMSERRPQEIENDDATMRSDVEASNTMTGGSAAATGKGSAIGASEPQTWEERVNAFLREKLGSDVLTVAVIVHYTKIIIFIAWLVSFIASVLLLILLMFTIALAGEALTVPWFISLPIILLSVASLFVGIVKIVIGGPLF